jgi:hypothetical protein
VATEAVWLPNERLAKAWTEFVTTGTVSDETPPPSPVGARATRLPDGSLELTWGADADLESGLKCFLLNKDGKTLAQVPERPAAKYGRSLFQSLSYHDTPEPPLTPMRYIDRSAIPADAAKHVYQVIAVNGAGLESLPARCQLLP